MSDRLASVRARMLAETQGVPYVDVEQCSLDPAAVRSVPLEVLERVAAIPYEQSADTLRVAFASPSPEAIAELERVSGRRVEVSVTHREALAALLSELAYGCTLRDEELQLEGALLEDAPAVRAVNDVLRRAIAARASDVHLVPDRDYVHVRFRVDGVVQESSVVPAGEAVGLLTRIKVLAGLDVAEHRRPQDGRFAVRTTAGRGIDIRVAILPTIAGEGLILRLLDKTRMPPSLTQLGLENAMQMELERVIDRSVGALLVTGPTGSGKTTTLHGALADLARPEVTVITIEDPVEYELRGAYQLQVNPAAGVTYASALRAVLRGDPDVIMVGEIRDAETAQLALGAALAGHFVLSTLHTGDAPSAVTRLHEMGVERYVVGAGLAAVLGQRLVRRLCLYCRERYEPAADVLEHAGSTSSDATFFRAVGCPYCSGGYYGRIGVFELLVLHDARPSAGLWSDALAKAEAGMTSLDELYRVVRR